MIGVAQDQRGADILEVFGRESLDRCLRTDGGKDWGDEVTMRSGENPRAGETGVMRSPCGVEKIPVRARLLLAPAFLPPVLEVIWKSNIGLIIRYSHILILNN